MSDLPEKTEQLHLDAEGKPLTKSALKKLQKEQEKAAKKAAIAARVAAEEQQRKSNEPDCSTGKYGPLPLIQSSDSDKTSQERVKDITTIDASWAGREILFRALCTTAVCKAVRCASSSSVKLPRRQSFRRLLLPTTRR